jgi:hypothetical protein
MRFPHFTELRYAAIAVAGALLVIAPGCDSTATSKASPAKGGHAREIAAADFGRMRFDRSTTIDNAWFPLRPGTQLVFDGSMREGDRRIRHREIFTVTDLTKVVDGVRTLLVWDRDYTEGRLVEGELTFFAQDNRGNVWHLGQYPEEYDKGKYVGAPAWLAGLKGAKAGIVMKAAPRLGTPKYSQGFAPPPINWVDHAKIFKTGAATCVPVRCYRNVLVTREFETGKPDAFQVKYYARGLGNIRVGWAGAKDEDREVLVLVKVNHLGHKALLGTRAGALQLEGRAYKNSKQVYGRTRPAVPR